MDTSADKDRPKPVEDLRESIKPRAPRKRRPGPREPAQPTEPVGQPPEEEDNGAVDIHA